MVRFTVYFQTLDNEFAGLNCYLRLAEQDVGRVINNESVVALGSTLLGKYGFSDRAVTCIDARTPFANPVAWPIGWKRLIALEADASLRGIAIGGGIVFVAHGFKTQRKLFAHSKCVSLSVLLLGFS